MASKKWFRLICGLLTLLAMSVASSVQADPSGIEIPLPSMWASPDGMPRPMHRAPAAAGPLRLSRPDAPSASINSLTPPSANGRVAVIVHTAIYDSVGDAVAIYTSDLAAAGYSSVVYRYESGSAESLRTYLAGLYGETAGLKGAVLVGDIPYVIYECMQDWDGSGGAAPEYEDFPCDVFYMDLNGTWSDSLTSGSVQPSNGKYDTRSGNIALEIWVGRIKTGNLGSIGGEAALVNSYFTRNHDFRTGGLFTQIRALIYDDDDWIPQAAGDQSAVSSVFGAGNTTTVSDAEATTAADYKSNRLTQSTRWYLVRSHGYPGGHGFYRSSKTVFDYVFPSDYLAHPTAGTFFSLFVCSGCDYTAANNLGSIIAMDPDSTGLLSMGSTKTGGMWADTYFYSPMAGGACVGESFRQWFNSVQTYYPSYATQWWYGMVMLGDPALQPSDNTGPTVTIDQASSQADPTNTSPINFTVVFSEPVTDFTTGDVTLSGTAGATTATVTGSGTSYNVAVSGMTGSGTVVARIGAGVSHDASGNGSEASSSTDNEVSYGIPGPTVTINQAVSQADPTSSAPINFTVVFGEPVSDFVTGDVTLSGTAGARLATVTGAGTTYNVAVREVLKPGTVIASVAAGVAHDGAGNVNMASASADNEVMFGGNVAGYLAVWGSNAHGQCNVPAGDDFVAVAAGGYHSVALRSDGSLAAWGDNSHGECDFPAGNNYIAVAAGLYHCVAIRSDGSLTAWGYNSAGQCDVPAGNDYVAVAAGGFTDVAIRSDGSLISWGIGCAGSVPEGNNFVAVSALCRRYLALRSDGSLVSWGPGGNDAPAGNDYAAIVSGLFYGLALKSDGSLSAWGSNTYGEGDVPAGNNYVAVATGSTYSLALKSDGSLAAWGWNEHGQCSIPAGNGFAAVSAGWHYGVAITTSPLSPSVTSIAPNAGENSGSAGITDLAGTSFVAGATVRLTKTGEADILATDVTVVSSTRITCSFDLSGKDPGTWDVTVTNTDGRSGILPGGFTVLAADTTPPTATINQAVGQADPTSGSPISFTVVFSEPVADFATGDITLSGTAGATSATVTGTGTTYNVAVSGMPVSGSVIATIAAGVAHDAAGNPNEASTSTDNEVTFTSLRGDWWMFQHDPQHTGSSPFVGPTLPTEKWRFGTGGYIFSSPAIASDGTIYIGSFDNNLYAINPDGSEKWRFATSNYVQSAPAIGTDGTIYVGSSDNSFYAINPDGSEKWRFATGATVVSSPTIGPDGTLFVGSGDSNLYAINPDGSEKWRFLAESSVYSSPAIDSDGTIYVVSGDKLYAVRPDGSEKWRLATGYSLHQPAVGPDGTIYVGSVGSFVYDVYAINPDGTEKWRFPTGQWVYSCPAIGSDGTIYVGSADNNLYAINPDGSEKWRFVTGYYVLSSPAIGADGTIYAGSLDNNFYAINPDGSEKWRLAGGDYSYSSPAIGSDGTVYVGGYDGNLRAIGPAPPTVTSITPNSAPNSGAVDITDLAGTNFCAGATMRLTKSGETDISATDVAVVGSTRITCSFDLAGKAPGAWDVVVTNTDGRSGTLSGGFTVIAADTTLPIVTINQTAEQADPTSSSRISFTVVFSEPVFDFATGDITLSGTAGATTATVTGSGTTYDVAASGMAVSGTVVAGIAAGVAHDAAGNPNEASTSTDNEVTFNSLRGDWWMFHHDAQHTGRSPFVGPELPTVKWAYNTWGGHSSPAVAADGSLYIGSWDGNLYAMNPDGTRKWRSPTGAGLGSSPAIGTDGTVYVGSDDGNLYAINPDSSQKWCFATGGPVRSSPAIGADGTIYVGSYDGNLYAVGPDGEEQWRCAIGMAVFTSPAVGPEGTIYIGSDSLYAVSPNGALRWRFATSLWVESSPAVGSDGTIYAGSGDSVLYAVNPDGSEKWRVPTSGFVDSSPTIGPDGVIYVGSADKNLYAINPDGSERWRFATDGSVYSSPAIGADGTVYVGSYDRCVYAVAPDGSEKWRFATGAEVISSPVLGSDGTLYVQSNDSSLYAVGPAPPAVTAITPTSAPNSGSVNITDLAGTNFCSSPTVKLTKLGEADIVATGVTVVSQTQITCSFDFRGKAPGGWDVVVTNTDGRSGTLFGGFTIMEADTTGPTVTINQAAGQSDPTSASPINFTVVFSEPVSDFATGDVTLSGTAGARLGTVTGSGTTYNVAVRYMAQSGTVIASITAGLAHDARGNASLASTSTDNEVTYTARPLGYLVAWGWNYTGQCNVPPGSNYTAVSSGTWHGLALKSDGSMAAWGDNSYGQCDHASDNSYVAISAGAYHNLALRSDGSIAAWGYNVNGECSAPEGHDFVAISAGGFHNVALKSDGSVVAWGWSYFGQCNVPSGSDFVAVDAGLYHSVALRLDGSLVAWGDNNWRQLDNIPARSGFAAVTAGGYSSLALESDGTLAAWGLNQYGQCNVPAGSDHLAVDAGWNHSLALRSNGSLTAWGDDSSRQCSVPAGSNYIAVAAGALHSAAISTSPPFPTVISIDPGAAPNTGSTTFTDIRGIYFQPGATVKLAKPGQSDTTATDVTVVSQTQITCSFDLTGRPPGSWDVIVTNTDGRFGTLVGGLAITDGTPPTVTINQASGQADPTSGLPINFAVVFSEPVSDFATGDVTLSGSAGATTATVTGSGTTYDVAVSGMAASGSVIATIAAGVAHDAAGNPNEASTSTDNDVTFVSLRGNWWMFRHDPQHSGRSPFVGPELPTEKWRFQTGGLVYSSPAIASDGTIYVGSDDGKLYAIDCDGVKAWEFPTGNQMWSSPAIGHDGAIYVGSANDSSLHAINPNGSSRWTFPTGAMVLSSPLIGPDGVIYVGSYDGCLYAVNPDGSQKWAFVAGGDVYGSPAIASDGTVYVGSSNGNLYAIDPDGSKKWEVRTGGIVFSSPAVGSDGTIYVGSYDGDLYAVDPGGFTKWQFHTGSLVMCSPAIGSDGTVYFGSDNVYAVNPDGSERWRFVTSATVGSSPAVDVHGTIYVGCNDNNVYAINPDGSQKWLFATPNAIVSSPAIAEDGTLYIGTYGGVLYAIGPASPTVTSITPESAPNSGSVSITRLAGTNFCSGATVKLTKSGEADISATDVAVVGSTKMTCLFDLTGTALGAWDVVVTNTDGRSGTLAGGLTITDGVPPTVTIDQAAGQADPTSGSPINFTVVFSEPVTDFADGDVTISGTAGGTKTVLVTGSGDTYNVAVSGMTTPGTVIVSVGAGVAHDAAGNGNEASSSTDNSVLFDSPPQNVSVTPNSGVMPIGATATLTAAYSDPDGNGNLRACYLLINDIFGHANGVSLYYNALVNKVYLKDDAGTTYSTGHTPGTDVVLSNSQCEVYVKNTVVSRSGNNLSVAWSIKLKPTMAGKLLSAWLSVSDVANIYDSWEKLGTYANNVAPQNYSVAPSAGTLLPNVKYTVTSRYRDLNGASDLRAFYLLVNDTLSHVNGVSVYYNAANNRVYLKDDANTTYGTGYAPGTDVVLSNSQCELYIKDIVITPVSSTDVTVAWSVKFTPAFAGKVLSSYMSVYDRSNAYDSWEKMGSYNSNTRPEVVSIDPASGVLPVDSPMTVISLYRDANGWGNVKSCYLIVNRTLNHVNAVSLLYDAKANKVYLRDDANTTYGTGHAPGTDVVLSNSQCEIYVKDTTVSHIGATDLSVGWSIKLKPTMAGKTLGGWLMVYDKANAYDGWKKLGAYITP